MILNLDFPDISKPNSIPRKITIANSDVAWPEEVIKKKVTIEILKKTNMFSVDRFLLSDKDLNE